MNLIYFHLFSKQEILKKKNSDLDIFIAGKYDKEKIKKISEIFGIDISIKSYPINMFEKNIYKDILLKEILKNHVVFVNAEQFIRIVLKK